MGHRTPSSFSVGPIIRWMCAPARAVCGINRAELRLEGRGLLNRNVGVNYSNTSMYIQEERIQALGRYVMLTFVYNLGATRQPGAAGVIPTFGG